MKTCAYALSFVLVMLALGSTDVRSAEQHGSYVKNERWGYKLRAPKKWKRRVIRLDEQWIADKFFPDYPLRTRNELNEAVSLKPELWVIGFPLAREKERVKVEKPDEHTTIITIRNPYKNYKDFVKRESWASTGAGGWYYAREDEVAHEGYVVDVYEIKVEKLVRAPLRIVTWVYHCEGVDFAVQIRILEDHYAANKNVIDGVMKSFREIPRTEPFPTTDDAGGVRRPDEEEELSLEEINALRVRKIEERIERELKHLPDGWRAQKSKHFVALTQHKKVPTSWVLNFAEEIRKYLEKSFSELGPATVPRGLIRVFKSSADESAYNQGTSFWWADEVGEITLTFGHDAHILSEFSNLADRLADQYFHIKNENLRWGMPGWIRAGIWGHIRWGRPSKRKKMILQPMPHDILELRRMIAANEQLPLRTLMQVSTNEYGSYGPVAQAKSVTFWLLGRGNKGKVKGAIAKYLLSLEEIIKEEDKEFEVEANKLMEARMEEARRKAAQDAKKTDEELEREEDEAFRDRRQKRSAYGEALKSKYQAIRERAFEAAFGHLKEKDWESLDKKWKKFAGGK